ncbi:MAG: ABC transporter permease [Propionibacteriaceae bacterium]
MLTDLISESFLSLKRRWRRNILTVITTSISAAAVLFITSFVYTAANKTANTIVALSGNTITATLTSWDNIKPEQNNKLLQLPGVEAAGILLLPGSSGKSADIKSLRSQQSAHISMVIADSAGLQTRNVDFVSGTDISPIESSQPSSLLLGVKLAEELGIGDPIGAQVQINGTTLGVSGIIADNKSDGALSTTAILTPELAKNLDLLPSNSTIVMRVKPGSGDYLKNVLPLAISPVDPSSVSLTIPPSPRSLQNEITAQSQLWVGIITIALATISALTISVTLNTALQERKQEIGIRRALGSTAKSITGRLFIEALVLSAFSGIIGSAVGAILVALVSKILSFSLIVPTIALYVPLGTTLIGGIASLLPAFLAQRIDPSELIRGL